MPGHPQAGGGLYRRPLHRGDPLPEPGGAGGEQEIGETFTEYVTGKRMDLARELLRNTDKRSGEVAAAVGYRDPHYFSFLFKKTQGCTPRDYRGGGKRP